MSIRDKALATLLAQLRDLGCAYKVKVGDELHTHGEIEPPRAAPKTRKHKVPSKFYYAIYKDLYLLKPGDSAAYQVSAPGDIKGLQACMSSTAAKLWGRGQYTTSYNKTANSVEIIRL